jgi:hypothetical protein
MNQLTLKLTVNTIAAIAVSVISTVLLFNIFYLKEVFFVVGFICSSLHIILFKNSVGKIDFYVQVVSVVLFIFVYVFVRFSIIGI